MNRGRSCEVQHRKLTLVSMLLFISLALTISCKNHGIGPSGSLGFIKAEGTKIVDGNGNPLILKGIGLGGWMLQEGYMLGTSGPQHEIRAYLESYAGKAATDQFYDYWISDFVNEKDIQLISEWGYNSIRLPMHYELYFDDTGNWMEYSKGLQLTDDLLQWCKTNNLYLILDLHAAPGGQGNNRDISDRRNGESLWEDDRFVEMTRVMWKNLARRYKDEPWIGGYDLLNEPNYDFESTGDNKGCACVKNDPLKELYELLIDDIRAIDENHLLIIEGNCYGSNYKGLEPLGSYDPNRNLAFSFHNYWGQNSLGAMQSLLDLRRELDVPLWRGEIGENSNTWFTEMVELMEQTQIGYANWPYKKINSIDGPVLISSNPDWDKLMSYKRNPTGSAPTAAQAQNAMRLIAEAINIENAKIVYDVTYAYLKSPYGVGTQPYKEHKIPGKIFLTDYDYGKYQESWYDMDYQNTSGSSSNTAWNAGESYRNDGVDIWPNSDYESNGYHVGRIENGEYMQYTLANVSPGSYLITFRTLSKWGNRGEIDLLIDDNSILSTSIVIPESSSWTNVTTTAEINSGNKLTIKFIKGGFDCSSITFQQQ